MTLARTLLDNYFDNLFDFSAGWRPSVSTTETGKAYVIQMDVPGVARDDITLQCDRGILTLSGERRAPALKDGETALRTEAFYGKFARRFSLPESVATDGIEAALTDGVLTVRVPKATRGALAREIKIS